MCSYSGGWTRDRQDNAPGNLKKDSFLTLHFLNLRCALACGKRVSGSAAVPHDMLPASLHVTSSVFICPNRHLYKDTSHVGLGSSPMVSSSRKNPNVDIATYRVIIYQTWGQGSVSRAPWWWHTPVIPTFKKPWEEDQNSRSYLVPQWIQNLKNKFPSNVWLCYKGLGNLTEILKGHRSAQ